MTGFLEDARFPYKVSLGATGGPVWQTEVVRTVGAQEYRLQYWDQALRHYDVSHAARKQALYKELLAFFHAVQGRTYAFRFRDWSDYLATDAEGEFAVDSGFGLGYQMYKRYTVGGTTHHRKITKPFEGEGGITLSGSFTGTPVIDYATGIVTGFTGGAPTGWSGPFDVPCRFDIDDMRGEVINGPIEKRILGWSGITLTEVRL